MVAEAYGEDCESGEVTALEEDNSYLMADSAGGVQNQARGNIL